MIWLEELQTRKKISGVFRTYEKTFPEDERRSKEQFLSLAENPDVFVFHIKNENEVIGYAVIWELSGFWFLEHFEIFEAYRSLKYGQKVLEILNEKFGKIILESEPEYLNETAKRRIDFYRRNLFEIIDENYIQPSYDSGKKEVTLFLLCNFPVKNISTVKSEIYEKVYHHSGFSY